MPTSISRKTLLSRISSATLVYIIGSLNIEKTNLFHACHFCNQFQGKFTILLGILNGQLDRQIFQTSTFFLWGYWNEREYKDSPQTFTEVKEVIGKEITSFGSEVTKAVLDSVKNRAQDCIQSGGDYMINFVIEN